MRLFDVQRPGRDCSELASGELALVCCLAACAPQPALLAAGGSSRAALLLDVRSRESLLALRGHSGGVLHARFSACGGYLYTGARRDGRILCWDVRSTAGCVYALERDSEATNQRLAFDVEPCGRLLATGGCGGDVRLFDLQTGAEAGRFACARSAVAACAWHPCLAGVLAAGSGRRLFGGLEEEGEEGEAADCALRVWRGCTPLAVPGKEGGHECVE